MRKRVLRVAVLTLLLAAGVGAAVLIRDAGHRVGDDAARQIDRHIDQLLAIASDLGAAQAGYVAPGQNPTASLERFPELLRHASAATAETSMLLQSDQGQQSLRTIADTTARLAQADAVARDNLLLGDTLTASHIIFGEARDAITDMTGALMTLRQAESAELAAQRTAAVQRAGFVLGAVALLWVAGLLALVPLPASRESLDGRPAWDAQSLGLGSTTGADPVDLSAAAGLCSGIACVETTAELTRLLERAAAVLDASGIIIWMRGDDNLFAALSYGYETRPVERFGPVGRDDDNAAAAAWRLSEVQTVPAGETSGGAIVAPMCGPGGVSGVLAVELRHGREGDPATRAVVVMMAAQLSNVVAAEWRAAPLGAQPTGT